MAKLGDLPVRQDPRSPAKSSWTARPITSGFTYRVADSESRSRGLAAMTSVTSLVLRSLLTAGLVALAASAQTPIHEQLRCEGVEVSIEDRRWPGPLEPRNFRVGSDGLCSEYATAGWEATMHLHLGEGASDFLPQIEMAVALWNDALEGFAQRPVINIVQNVRPKNFSLDSGFWRNTSSHSEALVDDGQSVIYFKAFEGSRSEGFAHWRWRSNRLREADIYINTANVVKYGPHLFDTQEVFRYDDRRSVYAWVDSTYLTILHEIGHALGLEHVSVAGNIMSYNYMPKMEDVWNAPFAMLTLSLKALAQSVANDLSPAIDRFLNDRDTMTPYQFVRSEHMTADRQVLFDIYRASVVLGEQDRMALMCIYDFEDWNH